VQLETPEHRVGAGVRGAYERRVADGPVRVQPLATVGDHFAAHGRGRAPLVARAPRRVRPVQRVAAVQQVLDRLVQAALRGQQQWCHKPREFFRIIFVVRRIVSVGIRRCSFPATALAPVFTSTVGLLEFQQTIQQPEVVVSDRQQNRITDFHV